MRPVPSPVCSLFTLCDGDFGSEYKNKKNKKKKNAEKSEHLSINTNGRGNVDMDGTIIPQVTAHGHLGVMSVFEITGRLLAIGD